MKPVIVKATSDHAAELAVTMRDADKRECHAQCGLHPALALGATLANSEKAWTATVDGRVMCMFGVSKMDELDDSRGSPWMIGTQHVVDNARSFLRGSKHVIDEMHEMFPVLENHVDVRNTDAIRWLSWLGFDIMEAEPHGPFGLLFHPFKRERVL